MGQVPAVEENDRRRPEGDGRSGGPGRHDRRLGPGGVVDGPLVLGGDERGEADDPRGEQSHDLSKKGLSLWILPDIESHGCPPLFTGSSRAGTGSAAARWPRRGW
ncbi:MAG: hypothetical protein MZV64_34000 [Ignavibacteriales bacterium]|nr:hypothetical protein [Ignavibacteriales bacterium]